MCPYRIAMLHQTGDDGSARRYRQIVDSAIAMNLAVRREKSLLDKTFRYFDIGSGVLLKQGANGLKRNSCRSFALDMATHAIGQQLQQSVAGEAIAHADLVRLAAADIAFLIN